MRYLLLSSLLLTLYCCSPSRRSVAIAPADKQAITVFDDTTGAYLYKNKINLFGHYISGLMMIKPVGNNNYKVAIATEFGAKILDFEITDGQFILHDCIPEMRRKLVLNIVENDMKLLLGVAQFAPKDTSSLDAAIQYRFKTRPFNSFYTVNDAGNVTLIEGKRLKHTLVAIQLLDYKGSVPTKITLEHFRLPVHIELNIIKSPGDATE